MQDVFTLSAEEIAALPSDGGSEFNRLIFQQSPYLLQHARNPVDWYPWGTEAFEKAAREEKPVFLSIGYATCHWCHVMEHESFEDEEIAGLLNDHFVAVKVDREERPDLDHVYMAVTQGMTGSGGWPMTVVMTPDRKPFFAGTYFPRESRYGRPGMSDLLPRLMEAWSGQRDEVMNSAEEITQWLSRNQGSGSGRELDEEIFHEAYRALANHFDPVAGGFGQEPKFPSPHNLLFLLRYWKRFGEPHALEMVELTLEKMRSGGIHDQIGHGYHRYSTDPIWLVPHFEKMLYDQALIAEAALDTFLATGKQDFADIAREIFTYVLRDLTDGHGGFYSAEDADSEGEEGRFYLWTTEEVGSVLGEDAPLFCRALSLEEEGNYRDEATGELTGRNIPHQRLTIETVAAESGLTSAELDMKLENCRRRLFDVRQERAHPLKDDKILTDWNGLMISALARGGRVLSDETFTLAAERAAHFIWNEVRDAEGRLLKRSRQGIAGLSAHVDDYAFYLRGLIDLYEATGKVEWLGRSTEIADQMVKYFHDPDDGGFFFTGADSERLIVRKKEIYDGAVPSGNSVAALSLLCLSRMTARSEWEEIATGIIRSFGEVVGRAPAGYTYFLSALDFLIGPSIEVVVAGNQGAEDTRQLLEALSKIYQPNMVTLFRPTDEEDPEITTLAPWTRTQVGTDDRATAYVCMDYTCHRPVTEKEKMMALITDQTGHEVTE
ncbi:thioredoxin domain-containing protein [Candidatus Zixiibacteriota bacterium]